MNKVLKVEFDEDSSDAWVCFIRSATAAAGAPLGLAGSIIGPVLGELIGNSIPKERLDRIVAYLKFLRETLADERAEVAFDATIKGL